MNAATEAGRFAAELSAMFDEFRVCGPDSVTRAEGPPAAGSALVALLTAGIYERYHARTGRGRTAIVRWPDPQFRASLARANRSRSHWDAGWQVCGLGRHGEVVARKPNDLAESQEQPTRPRQAGRREAPVARGGRGRVRWARPGEFLSAGPHPVGPGKMISLWVPRDMPVSDPAFYLALGESLPDLLQEVPALRIYFHVAAVGAAALLECVTGFCNRRGLPFGMKCLAHPAAYDRADAAVLYIAPRHYDVMAELLGELPNAVRQSLRPDTPLFAKRLGDGVALAEQPGTGESFGQHRSRLLAEAMLLCWTLGGRAPGAGLATIRQHFAANGIDLDRPYLSPGSADRYTALPDPSPGVRGRQSAVRGAEANRDANGARAAEQSTPTGTHAVGVAVKHP